MIVKNRENVRYLKTIFFWYFEAGHLTNFYVSFSREAKQLLKNFVKTHVFLLQSVSDALRPDMDSHISMVSFGI